MQQDWWVQTTLKEPPDLPVPAEQQGFAESATQPEQQELAETAVQQEQQGLSAAAVQNGQPGISVTNVLKELPAIPGKIAGKTLGSLKVTRRKLAGSQQNVKKNGGIRKTLLKGGTASLLGLSITIAGLFGTPEELIRQQTISQLHNPEAVEMMIEEEDPGSDEDLRKKAETRPEKKGFFQKITEAAKQMLYKVPVPVRAIAGLPLWAVGSGILYTLSGLYSAVLAPVLSHIIGFALCALILLAVFTLTMKTIFPNMPLKKILRKRNIIRVLIGAAVLKAADIVLPLFWGEYTRYKYMILLVSGLIVLAVLIVPRILRRRRRRAVST